MQRRQRLRKPRGAALVEAAIMTTLFLSLVLGMLDLSLCLYRQHVASEAARQGARAAVVHGYFAANSSSMNTWGPSPSYFPPPGSQSLYSGSTTHTVQADDASDALAAAIRPYLVGLDPNSVTLTIEWLDGDNQPGSRVRVSVSLTYTHLMTLVYCSDDWTSIGASSTMTIMH